MPVELPGPPAPPRPRTVPQLKDPAHAFAIAHAWFNEGREKYVSTLTLSPDKPQERARGLELLTGALEALGGALSVLPSADATKYEVETLQRLTKTTHEDARRRWEKFAAPP